MLHLLWLMTEIRRRRVCGRSAFAAERSLCCRNTFCGFFYMLLAPFAFAHGLSV